jgi:hypothetical protein
MSTSLPLFVYKKRWSRIVPLHEKDIKESGNFLALPSNINAKIWEAYGNQLALHDGTLMIVRIPPAYM